MLFQFELEKEFIETGLFWTRASVEFTGLQTAKFNFQWISRRFLAALDLLWSGERATSLAWRRKKGMPSYCRRFWLVSKRGNTFKCLSKVLAVKEEEGLPCWWPFRLWTTCPFPVGVWICTFVVEWGAATPKKSTIFKGLLASSNGFWITFKKGTCSKEYKNCPRALSKKKRSETITVVGFLAMEAGEQLGYKIGIVKFFSSLRRSWSFEVVNCKFF